MNVTESQLAKAVANYRSGRYSQALKVIRPFLHRPDSTASTLHLAAAICIELKNFAEGLHWVSAAISQDPSEAEFVNTKGAILLEQGDLPAAVASFAKAIELNDQYSEALRNHGLALFRLGACHEAESSLRSAVELNPTDASAVRLLAETQFAGKKFRLASDTASRLVELAPGDARGHVLLVRSLLASGAGCEIEPILERTASRFREDPNLIDCVAEAFIRIGAHERAVEYLDDILAEESRNTRLRVRLALALVHGGNRERLNQMLPESGNDFVDEPMLSKQLAGELIAFQMHDLADQIVTRLLSQFSRDQRVLTLRAEILTADGKTTEAHRIVESLDCSKPDDLRALLVAANVYAACGNQERAIQLLRRYLASYPEDEEACTLLAELLLASSTVIGVAPAPGSMRQLRLEEAHVVVRRAMSQVDNPKLLSIQGRILHQFHLHDRAAHSLREAIALSPNCIDSHHSLGICLQEKGEFDQAAEHFRKALALDPNHVSSIYQLAMSGSIESPESEVSKLESLLAVGELSQQETVLAYTTVGRLYDQRREYDRAFESYQRGNQHKGKPPVVGSGERDRNHLEFIANIERVFSSDFFGQRQGWGSCSERPIFVVGLPRSGTTLVEQILASHPEIHGTGELQDISCIAEGLTKAGGPAKSAYPEAVASLQESYVGRLAARHDLELASKSPDSRYVVDKMPTNFIHLGLISLLFPNARIVHCRRQPLDVAVSCLRNNLQWPFCDQQQLGNYIGGYRRLVRHWTQVLSNSVFHLDYESLVENPDDRISDLLEFCEVPWSDACRSFQSTSRSVATPSKVQVRNPIYSTSIDSWKRYAKHLEPLRETLRSHGVDE